MLEAKLEQPILYFDAQFDASQQQVGEVNMKIIIFFPMKARETEPKQLKAWAGGRKEGEEIMSNGVIKSYTVITEQFRGGVTSAQCLLGTK